MVYFFTSLHLPQWQSTYYNREKGNKTTSNSVLVSNHQYNLLARAFHSIKTYENICLFTFGFYFFFFIWLRPYLSALNYVTIELRSYACSYINLNQINAIINLDVNFFFSVSVTSWLFGYHRYWVDFYNFSKYLHIFEYQIILNFESELNNEKIDKNQYS